MMVSAKTQYACIAMLELAARQGEPEPVRIREIAAAHGIPSRFLVQILLQLKAAGLVQSVRGAAGGYRLARPSDEITLLDVMTVVDPQLGQAETEVARGLPTRRVLHEVWQRVAQQQREVLASVTLAELVDRLRDAPAGMYYI
jgi:Rrf2 family protein